MQKVKVIPLMVGLIGLTVLMLFPIWNVTYRNDAGLDQYVLKDDVVKQTRQDEGVVTLNTAAKRGFLFGGIPKVGLDLDRSAPTPQDFERLQIKADADGIKKWDCPWQVVSYVSGTADYKRMLIEAAVVIFLSFAWYLTFYLYKRKKAWGGGAGT